MRGWEMGRRDGWLGNGGGHKGLGGKERFEGGEQKEGMHSWGKVEEGLKVLGMGSRGWRVG